MSRTEYRITRRSSWDALVEIVSDGFVLNAVMSLPLSTMKVVSGIGVFGNRTNGYWIFKARPRRFRAYLTKWWISLAHVINEIRAAPFVMFTISWSIAW